MNWFVFIDNQQYGPYLKEEIVRYIEEGRITSDSFIWRPGFLDWKAATQVEDLAHCFPTEIVAEDTFQKNNHIIYGSLNRMVLLLCCLAALGYFGFCAHSIFQDRFCSIYNPVQAAISLEGEHISDTVKLGHIEIPFTQVFADDTSGDGYPDRRTYYRDGLLVLAAWDTGTDGVFDLWFRFVNGEYVDLEAYDFTGDGNIEKLVFVDENEHVTAVELFSDKKAEIFDTVKALALPVLPLLFFCFLLARRKWGKGGENN
ncbi:MAG: DUF4339 domain-containing protein [Firmicutes bacterium]|nr:DUF4339 domain-containing protein [Bacillota bacterium]